MGLGNIGRKVAGIAKAFGCDVVYYSTSGTHDDTKIPPKNSPILQNIPVIDLLKQPHQFHNIPNTEIRIFTFSKAVLRKDKRHTRRM